MTAARAFPRRIDALAEVVDFTAQAFAEHGVDAALRADVDLVIEELFTNMAKYGAGDSPVRIEIAGIPGGVQVAMTEFDAAFFDPTGGPAVDVTLPAAMRQPGGLGLHLIRRIVDSIEYRYSQAERCSRITFQKTRPPPRSAGPGESGSSRC